VTEIANNESFDAWNGDSGQRWADEADRRDGVLAPVSDVLLEATELRPGEHVLDLGCGCATTTLAAARAVEPNGAALGIDLSAPMLEIARRRRADARLTNIEFVQGDAQAQAFSPRFDAAISRFGTMFFADPTAAFVNIARGLRSSGRLCLATWQPLIANEWLTIPGAALLRYGTIPESADGGPGMFAQSDPDTVTATLRAAGFDKIELTPVTVTLFLGDDVDDATDYLATSGVGRAVLETVPSEKREAAISAVSEVLSAHVGVGGVCLDGAIWIVTAARVG
jgi:ubiquinone/menaquinone biosynthesis C-methylase UbiE